MIIGLAKKSRLDLHDAHRLPPERKRFDQPTIAPLDQGPHCNSIVHYSYSNQPSSALVYFESGQHALWCRTMTNSHFCRVLVNTVY
jgi:hypothetical protein